MWWGRGRRSSVHAPPWLRPPPQVCATATRSAPLARGVPIERVTPARTHGRGPRSSKRLSRPTFRRRERRVRLQAGDLRGAHHRGRAKSRTGEIGNREIVGLWGIFRAGDHDRPDQPERVQLWGGNDERRTPLLRKPVGIGKRNDDHIPRAIRERARGRHRLRRPLRSPTR